jgi:hypothetical protein
MARRLVLGRIESHLERPQDRTDFKHPDLLGWIAEERPRLVSAALVILRAYATHDYPDTGCPRWGSFEEWSRLIPHAMKFAGGPDVLRFRPPDDDDDAVTDAALLRTLLACLEKLCGTVAPMHGRQPAEGLTSGEIVDALFKRTPHEDVFSLRDALRDITQARTAEGPSPQAVGNNLAKYKGRPLNVAGRLLRLVKVKDTHKGAGDRWSVEVLT